MNDSENRLGEMIRIGRREHQWTQQQFAEKLGVSAFYIRRLESGKIEPSLDLFCKAVRLLNLSADAYIYPEKSAGEDASM